MSHQSAKHPGTTTLAQSEAQSRYCRLISVVSRTIIQCSRRLETSSRWGDYLVDAESTCQLLSDTSGGSGLTLPDAVWQQALVHVREGHMLAIARDDQDQQSA